jgi:hypothetical protein
MVQDIRGDISFYIGSYEKKSKRSNEGYDKAQQVEVNKP